MWSMLHIAKLVEAWLNKVRSIEYREGLGKRWIPRSRGIRGQAGHKAFQQNATPSRTIDERYWGGGGMTRTKKETLDGKVLVLEEEQHKSVTQSGIKTSSPARQGRG